MGTTNSLCINNLTVKYALNTALNGVTFSVSTGKLIGIIGPNGAGKSTLIKAMLGLVHSSHKGIIFNSKPINTFKKQISYVKQRQDHDITFPIQVKDVVMLGIYPKLGFLKYPSKLHKSQVLDALKQVNMQDFYKKQIGELSGGQLQRVFLARVIVQGASLIFLDEPFVGIDAYSEQTIMQVIKRMRNQGNTIIIVYHDLHKVTEYFDQVIILNKELIACGDTTTTFTKQNIAKAYKSSLLDFLKEGEF